MKKHLEGFEIKGQSTLDKCLKTSPYHEKFISHLYDTVLRLTSSSSEKFKISWDNEIGIQIPEDLWEEILEPVHKFSNDGKYCLIRFKIIHRLNCFKVKIHSIYPNVSPVCEKCQSLEASLFHSFVSCPKVKVFWNDIFSTISNDTNSLLKLDPLLIIFGTTEELRKLRTAQQQLLSYCLIPA